MGICEGNIPVLCEGNDWGMNDTRAENEDDNADVLGMAVRRPFRILSRLGLCEYCMWTNLASSACSH